MKSVLITGASGGIGGACAELFAENGWNVLACYRNGEAEVGRLLEKEYAGKLVPFYCDVCDIGSVRRAVSKAIFEFGGIDAAVINAGAAHACPLFSETEEEYDRMEEMEFQAHMQILAKRARNLPRSEIEKIREQIQNIE